jgi:hypothetical protein
VVIIVSLLISGIVNVACQTHIYFGYFILHVSGLKNIKKIKKLRRIGAAIRGDEEAA